MSEARKRTFEEHLTDLHRFYGPDVRDLPTADNILNRVAYPDDDITYDQRDALIKWCLFELNQLFDTYGRTHFNIVTMEKADNFFGWVLTLPVEVQITTLRSWISVWIFPTEDKRGRKPANFSELVHTLEPFIAR